MQGGGYSAALIFKSLLNYFLCGYSVYYFIILIIECYLLAPWLVRHNDRRTLKLVAAISVVATCGLEYIRFWRGLELPLIVRGSFIILLLFFYMGVYLSRCSIDYSLRIPVAMMTVGLILGLCHTYVLAAAPYVCTMHVGQKVTLYLFDAGFILFCMSSKVERWYRDNHATRLILRIGEISFGIYFTHVYLIFLADRFFPSIRSEWLLLWSLSLLLTIAVILAVKRVAPDWSRRFLGYR